MKKNMITTTSIREIKNSYKRFLSLLFISMLGVCVFVGIKMSAPDMLKSLDAYYDSSNNYDIKIISTLGLTKNDINELNKVKGVKDVYGSYSYDTLIKNNDNELVLKVIGITNDVNKVQIIDGKKPNKNNEVVVEKNFLEKENLKIGDKITLLDDNQVFKENELFIVGTVKSPLYINSDTTSKGTTNLGTGKINYYVYVNSDNFNIDYYTEAYVIVDGAKEKVTNSSEYNKLIDECLENINKIKANQEESRYYEVYNKAYNEIVENENNGLEKLNSAKQQLDNFNKQLINGKSLLDSAKKQLDYTSVTLSNTKTELDKTKSMLDDNARLLSIAKQEIDDGKAKINEELNKFGLTLDDVKNLEEQIKDGKIPKEVLINMIPTTSPYYDEIISIIDYIYSSGLSDKFLDFINNLNKEELINAIPKDIPYYDEIVSVINEISDSNIDDEIKENIISGEYIEKIIENIPSDAPYYEELVNFLNIYKDNYDKVIQLVNSIKKIQEAEKEYEKSISLYISALEKYNNANLTYISYYNEYQNGLSSYNNSFMQYNNNLNLYNTKVEEYYNSKKIFDLEISSAKEKLNEIPKAKWYVYDRLDDSGYSGFIDDGQSVTNLSKIFPTIFFVVAVLISLISMSRMVEDDRGLIGTLKSLGFSNKHIRKKYMLYSGIATILGGILGSIIGFFALPLYVWNIYKILFDIPTFKYDFNPTNVIVGILIATICICGTTLITIRKIVKEKPSELMRPKAPSVGKRVLLEKLNFIWKRINFSNKITIRNLSRYKKRVFMTVLGIMGCTALMLAGFGIRDSIVEIPNKQYTEVFNFDEMIYITGNPTARYLDEIFDSKHIKNYTYTNMVTSTTVNNYSLNIFVPNEKEKLKNVVSLKDIKTNEELKLEDNKIIITDKLAELTNKKVGDKLSIVDTNNKTHKFIISGICKNYVGNYAFMSKKTYEDSFGEYKINVVYMNISDLKYEEQLSKDILKNDNVISMISVNSTISSVDDTLKSLNSVVLLLIVLSGALSFVVLYNLSNINISERKREIATLKVLGFTDKEVDNYINKETIILTVIGIILGLAFGILLTFVILDTVEIEMVRFLRNINLSSFIITAIMIFLFALIVNRIIHFALKKIDMIESLKSVE